MFCVNCGTKINDGDSFCTNCGVKVFDDSMTKNNTEANANNNLNDLAKRIMNTKCVNEYLEETLVDKMDTIKFGLYPQSDTSGKNKEPIEWLVLEKDSINKHVLLISKFILESKSFDENKYPTNHWTDSSIRKWLNDEFYNLAFNDCEKDNILYFDNISREPETENQYYFDKVFLLNSDEYIKYFGVGQEALQYNKRAACRGTAYAKIENKLYVKNSNDVGFEWRNGNSCFWLCDEFDVKQVVYVNYDGYLSCGGCDVDSETGVRPAIWIRL